MAPNYREKYIESHAPLAFRLDPPSHPVGSGIDTRLSYTILHLATKFAS